MNPDAGKSLTPERWQRIEAIFHEALQTPEAGRADFILKSCAGDPALFTELRRLLAAFEDEKRFRLPAAGATIEPKGRLGETIGGYRLDAELGQGGMGTVYLAHRADGEFEQQVALKVVSAHLRTQFFTERFRAERQILAGLNHSNITRLLDGGVSATGDPFLAMEYVDGQPIDRYCDARLLAVPDRIRLFLQACSAVEYAHRKLVVHRDLKPGNILVTADSTPKLLDFGTAKLLLAAPAESTTTRFHAMTLRYASPEQLRGEPVSTSMDVYSLGVMLYELTVGAWPFGDPDSPIAGLERAVRDIDPAPPRSLITDESARLRSTSKPKLAGVLDGDLGHVISKAIEADPRRRYTSVEQLSADLRRYLAGRPVLAREHTWFYRGARFAQRHRWRLAAGAVLTAGLGFSVLTAVEQYVRGQRRMVQVRNLSQSYLTDILNEVGKLPGSMQARLLIVDRARGNLDQLLPEAPNDPELRRALAAAYLQLGDIQGKPFTVSLGDTAGAIRSYRIADAMARQAGDRDWEMLAVLVRARRMIAQIDARAGRTAEAVSLLNSALAPAKRLWQDAPPDLQVDGKPAAALYVEANLTLGYTMLTAVAAIDLPGNRQALAQLQRTVGIAEEVQASHPGMPDMAGTCSQYVGFALEGLGRLTGDAAYFKEGATAHRRAADATCKLFEKEPRPATQRNCADSLGELSWALHRAGEGTPAVQAASHALALMEPVSAAEPNSVEAQQDLTNAYFHLGAAENTAGKFHEAIGHLRTAESRIGPPRQIPTNDPFETARLYVDVQREMASALLATHNTGGAVEVLERAASAVLEHPKLEAWRRADVQRQLEQARALLAASARPR
jgi:eukaryotic-like serine/threonine-protein kinase